ncbi:MAG TPA: thioredoxin fold domain-containing protein [Gammaproteobacteria bacterium]|jgi:thioredoxin-related protein
MRVIVVLAFSLLFAQAPVRGADEGALEEGLVNPGYVQKPEWFKASFLDLREDVAEAAEGGKRVMLYFYQDGCPYCEKLINTNFAQRDIAEKARENLDVIAINLWGDTAVTDLQGREVSEKQFARELKVQFTPTLLFLDEQGDVALRLNGYYPPHKFMAALDYVAARHEKKLTFRDYLAQRQPLAASGKLHIEKGFLQPPYDLRRKAGDRPLLVLFEQKECPVCDEMHGEAFRRRETRELLAAFDVALLDIWDKTPLTTPDGKRMAVTEWVQERKIQYTPSMTFFDERGREVFRTEAYLRSFHLQSAMDYVASGAYKTQTEFQRFVQERADRLREQGIEVDLWK